MLWCDEKTACDYKRRIKWMVLYEQYGFFACSILFIIETVWWAMFMWLLGVSGNGGLYV